MNTKNLKAYAPKARRQFIEAVQKRAAHFGIYEDRIVEAKEEGSSILIEGRVFTKQQGQQRKRLAQRVEERGYEMFTREMAYTWFNRLAAIRYMEIHDYLEHGFRVLSHPSSNDSLPEILDHASDVADTLGLDKNHIIDLQLAGDKEEELYRELLLGQCHYLAKIMPFVFKGLAFEAIDDATELLLPDNLTKTDSILKGLINEIPEEDWSEIEVIGWLYQFYISEHKDAVIGKVVKSEDIPAATQLFTPNWIVKYLVQNSVGRQWLATYPDSELKGKMEYYIEPAEQSDDVIEQLKTITPTSIDPEQIKVLDPAAGSGHILVEVYEVLREIYLERGYRLREIPELILTKNIYGLDIDDRAAQLAGFALMMKAREDDRRIFQRVEDGEVTLNVFSLQSTEGLDVDKLWQALNLEGNQQQGSTGGLFDNLDTEADSFVQPIGIYKEYFELLQMLKSAFLQAKTLGSLIQVENEHLQNLVTLKELLQAKEKGSDPSAKKAAVDLMPVVNQAISLAHRYDAVIANPPYMGNKGMNSELKAFGKKYFPDSKSDLFAIFIERGFDCIKASGFNSMVTMQSWMFLSSFQKLRERILDGCLIDNMVHMGNGVMKIAFGTCATIFQKSNIKGFLGSYSYCENEDIGSDGIPKTFPVNNERLKKATALDFKKIPASPIVYWVPKQYFDAFENNISLGDLFDVKRGMTTSNNEKFLRFWAEIDIKKMLTTAASQEEATKSNAKWFPYSKGGGFRKWFGFLEYVVNWENNGEDVINYALTINSSYTRTIVNIPYYFQPSVGFPYVTNGDFSMRWLPNGCIYDSGGPGIFAKEEDRKYLIACLNSKPATIFLKLLNPTINLQIADVVRLPINRNQRCIEVSSINRAIEISKDDWDSQETSWEFKLDKLLKASKNVLTIKNSFNTYFDKALGLVNELKLIEQKNNKSFIDSYSLEGLVTDDVSESKITLFCNPKFRYSGSENEINSKFRSDTLGEFLSYSIGCMMGRYSLEREGLVYAHSSNNIFKNFVAEGAYQTFPADDDGIVPLASEDWLFDDDASTRFKEFVKTVWGSEHLDENIEFVAESLCLHAIKPLKGNKGQGEGAMDTVRRYFSTQFFKDHCKTYKKRPIYWLFSSGKEKAFECLVYLHRYNEGTLSRMRTEYVTPLMGKYEHMLNHLADKLVDATSSEKRDIEKEQKSLTKKQAELRTFDEQLKHYAEMRITLDLDDGVKANYGKFGNLLADVKAIHGSAPKVVK